MNLVVNEQKLCGKPTRRGVCHIPLRGGVCFLHDRTDIADRNAKVARAFRDHNPEGFRQQRKTAGRAGFTAAGGEVWRAEQSEKARQWRLAHPSKPERVVMEILMEHLSLTVSYDREYVIEGDERAVDIAFPEQCCVIEIAGHQYKASFGESASRATKFEQKIAWLENLGWNVHVFDASHTADPAAENKRLLAWLSQHQLLD